MVMRTYLKYDNTPEKLVCGFVSEALSRVGEGEVDLLEVGVVPDGSCGAASGVRRLFFLRHRRHLTRSGFQQSVVEAITRVVSFEEFQELNVKTHVDDVTKTVRLWCVGFETMKTKTALLIRQRIPEFCTCAFEISY